MYCECCEMNNPIVDDNLCNYCYYDPECEDKKKITFFDFFKSKMLKLKYIFLSTFFFRKLF